MTRVRARLIVVLVLLAATLALFTLAAQYEVSRPQLLENGDFGTGFAGWRARGEDDGRLTLDNGVIHLSAASVGHSPSVRQTIMRRPGDNHVRLSAWVRHQGITTGLYPWNALRVLLVQKDAAGKALWERPHEVVRARGDGPWRQASQVFWLAPDIKSIEVVAALSQVAGKAQVRDIALDVVVEDPVFKKVRLGLSAAWLLALPWLAWPLLRQRYFVVFAIALAILAGTLAPHTLKGDIQHFIKEQRQSDPPPAVKSAAPKPIPTAAIKKTTVPVSAIWTAVHKAGHVSLFALLALASSFAWRHRSVSVLGGSLVVAAVSAETLQLLSLDRGAHPMDAGLNVLGVLAGLAIGRYLFRRTSRDATAPDLPNA